MTVNVERSPLIGLSLELDNSESTMWFMNVPLLNTILILFSCLTLKHFKGYINCDVKCTLERDLTCPRKLALGLLGFLGDTLWNT